MRIDLLLLALVFLYPNITATNKLENTRWSGVINAPAPTEAVLEFRKDSSFIWVNNRIIETMNYTVSGDTLTLTKITGSSPCAGDKGIYRFTTDGNVLKFIFAEDACYDRVAAWNPEGYKKQ